MTLTELAKSMSYGPAPEKPDNVDSWLDQRKRRFDLYINGQWLKSKGGKRFNAFNPATGDEIASLTQSTASDVENACQAAKKAFSSWSKLPAFERAKYLYAIARRLQKNSRFFAVLETLDNGKPIRESRDIDIPLVIRHFYHHAGWATAVQSEYPHAQPIGVVGQVIPWNFPLLMLAWKVAPALAAGNTVVLKPAEYTSLTALAFAELCDEVGLPKGVFNCITGDGKVGEALVKNKNVNKVAFTGSTEVGRVIRKNIAGSGKKLSLELGGKSPFIVFDDADLDSAVEGIVDAIWFNQGEVCCAGSRLLVQESVEEKFIAKLKRRMAMLKIGDPLEKTTDVGALVDPIQKTSIEALLDKGRKEGTTIWSAQTALPSKGCFLPPTLCTDVSPSSTLVQEEIFGPVLVAMSFRTHNDAVRLANNTRFGLAASIWTENINLALDLVPKIKAGTVWINSTNLFDAGSGFGGYRESGFGREGGVEGMREYLSFNLPETKKPRPREKSVKKVSKDDSMAIDRTMKHYIGGKQVRPDSGYSFDIKDSQDQVLGTVGLGNRKDIRNAVEAAHACTWHHMNAHQRSQILYFFAENLSTRRAEFVSYIQRTVNVSRSEADREFNYSLEVLFTYAGLADKFAGEVHSTPLKSITFAMREPVGVVGLATPDDWPLLGIIATLAPLLAMGNRIVLVPSRDSALIASLLYQVMDTSDIPGGAVNIVTGEMQELITILAQHADVDGLWYFSHPKWLSEIETDASFNMKRLFATRSKNIAWNQTLEKSRDFLWKACEIKNVWVPYGE